MSREDILSQTPPTAAARIPYGSDPDQFGDIRIPSGPGPHPVVMMIHGGFWRAKYDLTHAGHLCAALAEAGIATWNIEYRRVGNLGGGWPGSFEDVTSAYRFLPQLPKQYGLNTQKIVVVGHSAGGHLALMLAAREPSLRGVLALAPVSDLRRAWELHLSNDAVVEFLGGTPCQSPEQYAEASPIEVSIAVPQVLIHGSQDDTVPAAMSKAYVERKRTEQLQLLELPDCGHFELIDPASLVWATVRDAALRLLT